MSFWDILAPCWHLVEDSGLTAVHLAEQRAFLRGPCLVVGAGQGVLVEWLHQQGVPAEGVDASPVMIAAARTRRGLRLTEATAEQLPHPDGLQATVVLATGVLDVGNNERAVLTECTRVLSPGGHLLVGVFVPGRARVAADVRLGLCVGQVHQRARMAAIWTSPEADWPGLVARWTGTHPLTAADMAHLRGVRAELEAHAACLRRHGVEPVSALTRAFSEPVGFFTMADVECMIAESGLLPVRARSHGDVMVLVLQRPSSHLR